MRESLKMLLHYIAGVVILVTGAIHIMSGHFKTLGIIKSLEFYEINKVIFLAAVIYHALNGVRVISIELIPRRAFADVITIILLIFGLFLFVYVSLTIL